MYTQCPECSSSFRVTAEVLRQAAGKVRCGGCGCAFNSLDYLSEQKPASAVPPSEGDLAGSSPEPPRLQADESPETGSVEDSAALLETLDDFSGPDIRIEDTGIEWRVLGTETEEEEETVSTAEDDAGEVTEDNGSMNWFMDESPTPVDEQLSDEPGDMDAAEIFEPAKSSPSTDEMRFDDNTPLPDDFDFGDEHSDPAPAPVVEVRDEPETTDTERVDLAVGEPEDWEDLLGEVDETGEEYFAEPETTPGETRERGDARAEAPLPDMDAQFAAQAEAMGIDLSGIHARREQPESEAAEELTIDEELIAAAFETEAESRDEDGGPGEVAETIIAAGETRDDSEEHDEPGGDEETRDDSEEHDEPGGDEETRDDSEEHDEPGGDEETRDDSEEHDEPGGDGETRDDDEEFDELGELEVEEPEDLVEARDSELVANTEDDARLAAELGLLDEDESEERQPDALLPEEQELEDDRQEQVVPPLTEEEQTINMMIDQDLLAIAVEDEDGFASTIIQKQRAEGDEPSGAQDRESAALKASGGGDDEEGLQVETIIMEGEFVRDAFEEELLEAERRRSAAAKTEAASETDTADIEKQAKPPANEPVNKRMVAGIAVLVLLLGVQFIHHSRESLAVYPAFNNSIGPIYRVLGKPVTPAWDIAGWRFEATKGSTDESDEVLTIYSRIGNKSGEALPYPLINVSLTDRFEEIIGSKVLEPGDYLAENLDTREPVAPGETFGAVISIEAPDATATGFKLNVCYRQPGGRLRCAIDDFR